MKIFMTGSGRLSKIKEPILYAGYDIVSNLKDADIAITDMPGKRLVWLLNEVKKLPDRPIVIYRMRGDYWTEVKTETLLGKFGIRQFLGTRLFNKCDAIVTVSEWLKKVAEERVSVPVYSVEVPIDTNKFKPKKCEKLFDAVTVTNFYYWKKVRLLHKLASLDFGIKWAIAGKGKYSFKFKNLKAKYIGFVSDVANLLNSSRFMIYPSELDALPNAVLEAMACNIPVAVNDYPPVSNFSLLDGIEVFKNERDLREFIRNPPEANLRDYVVEHFSIKAISTKWKEVLEEVIG